MEIRLKLPAPIVTITVPEEKKKIVCTPDSLLVTRGTKVKFECDDYPFAVHFCRESPFPRKSYNGKDSITTGAIPKNKPAYKRYKYFVAVCKDEKVLTADPDIIIVP